MKADSTSIQLWRGFFPSWKFFDEIGFVPSLHFRVAASENEIQLKAWDPVIQKIRRRWLDLFFNPHGNALLFTDTLVRQFADDIQAGDSPEQLEHAVSFKIIYNLVLQEVKKYTVIEPQFYFQFKVVMTPLLNENNKASEDLLISSIYRGA